MRPPTKEKQKVTRPIRRELSKIRTLRKARLMPTAKASTLVATARTNIFFTSYPGTGQADSQLSRIILTPR